MTRTCKALSSGCMGYLLPNQTIKNEFVLSHITQQQLYGHFSWKYSETIRNKLPDRFDLLGEWEVGLSEIQYSILCHFWTIIQNLGHITRE